MQKLLLAFVTVALLFACNESPKEPVAVAKNSSWATSHLKGMVKTMEETSYKPDSTGKIGEMDSCCIEINVYNDKGYVETNTEKDSKGTTTEETVYERNEDDKFKSATTTVNGKQVWSRVTTYDADGKTMDAKDTDSTGQVTYFYSEVTENEIGQALSGKMFTGDSTYMGTWSFKYTDGLRTGRSWVDSTGLELYDYTGELNDKGFLAKMTGKVLAGKDSTTTTVETYTYDSYDEMGNWTQRTEYDGDGKATKVEKRTYAYFKKE